MAGWRWMQVVVAVVALAPAPALAQLLGGHGGLLPGVLGTVPGTIHDTTNTLDNTFQNTAAVVRDTVGRPANAIPAKIFEKDLTGAPVVRGEVLCLTPSDQTLATAHKLDFEIARQETLSDLGITVVVLRTPDGVSVTDALKTLRSADPSGSYDYNHVYNPSGGASGATGSMVQSPVGFAVRIGMIDAGLDRSHPALRDVPVESKGFAGEGRALATAHGTAVASLLVGRDGDFHGALNGATLYAADVYGGAPDGGSADDIARALAWLASEGVPVVNISLAGPPNMILGAATTAFVRRGYVLVAAVGNDGPAAPQRYPAAYAGVVGVTSVDSHRAIQIDAGRGADVSYAAQGVEVRAASLHHGYATVTGTSFASPIVAARFAVLMPRPDPAAADQARAMLERSAIDLGPSGRDPVFGYGYLDPPGATSSLANNAGAGFARH
jgi:hypothetical protein